MMRKLLVKIQYELSSLWKLLIPLLLLLTIFYGLAISLINVSVDIPASFFDDYDERIGYTNITSYDVAKDDIATLLNIADSYTAESKGITYDTKYINPYIDGDIILDSVHVDETMHLDMSYSTIYNAIGIDVRSSANEYNSEYIDALLSTSVWFEEDATMSTIISTQAAKLLRADIGDSIYIGEVVPSNLVKIIGIFENDTFSSTHVLLSRDFVLDKTIDTADIDVIIEDSSRVMMAIGVSKSVSDNVWEGEYVYYIKSIQWITAGLIMLGAIIVIASILITYSVSKFILNNRSKYINTSRLLGGKTTDIISIYSIIILIVEALATFLGCFVAIGLSDYATSVCSDIFELDITNSFDYYVPFVVFGALVLLTTFVMGILHKRLNKDCVINRLRDGEL